MKPLLPLKQSKRPFAPICDGGTGKVVTVMSRGRVFSIIIILLVGVLAVGAGLAVFIVKPKLDDNLKKVDVSWIPLRQSLNARYQGLSEANAALSAVGGPQRSVTSELAKKLNDWNELMLRPVSAENLSTEVGLANSLEALARRARANVAANPKLSADPTISAGFTRFDQQVSPNDRVAAYNRAAKTYETERSKFPNSLVAEIFGASNRPLLQLGN